MDRQQIPPYPATYDSIIYHTVAVPIGSSFPPMHSFGQTVYYSQTPTTSPQGAHQTGDSHPAPNSSIPSTMRDNIVVPSTPRIHLFGQIIQHPQGQLPSHPHSHHGINPGHTSYITTYVHALPGNHYAAPSAQGNNSFTPSASQSANTFQPQEHPSVPRQEPGGRHGEESRAQPRTSESSRISPETDRSTAIGDEDDEAAFAQFCLEFRSMLLQMVMTFRQLDEDEDDQDDQDELTPDGAAASTVDKEYDMDTCCICLDDMKDKELTRTLLSCRHTMHRECIGIWLKNNNRCPLCRVRVRRSERTD